MIIAFVIIILVIAFHSAVDHFCHSQLFTLKVYRMNDFDWWVDYSLEEACKNYLNETGVFIEEAFDGERIVQEFELDKFIYHDEPGDAGHTFREELAKRTQQGFFASTEY